MRNAGPLASGVILKASIPLRHSRPFAVCSNASTPIRWRKSFWPSKSKCAARRIFCHYWADWERPPAAPNIIRRDTRLYWQPQRQGTVGRCVVVGENPGSAESIFGFGFGATGPGRTGQSSTLPETTHVSLAVRHYDYKREEKRPTIGCSLEQSGKSMGHRNIRAS